MIATATLALLLTAGVPRATDEAASKATLTDIRNVGTAMMSWLTDQIVDGAVPEGGWAAAEPLDDKAPRDWTKCPAISRDDLSAILVPGYIREVPKEDGWGSDFEYCLELVDFNRSHYVVGIRSPGHDGTYDRADYAPGKFDSDDFDSDAVWLDGFFLRWPKNAER